MEKYVEHHESSFFRFGNDVEKRLEQDTARNADSDCEKRTPAEYHRTRYSCGHERYQHISHYA